jgi:hypothetical protein
MQSELPMHRSPALRGVDPEGLSLPITCDAERTVPNATFAKSTEAPSGNKNALRTGLYTAQAVSRLKELSRLIRAMRERLRTKPSLRRLRGRYLDAVRPARACFGTNGDSGN